MARPDSTVTSIAQVSGQSCGQAPRTIFVSFEDGWSIIPGSRGWVFCKLWRCCSPYQLAWKVLRGRSLRLDTPSGFPNFTAAHTRAPDRVQRTTRQIPFSILQENIMKRLAFVAAVLAVSACSKADNAAKDTATPA